MAGIDIITLALAKKFTRESLLGGGAVVGKNVIVSSIVPIDGGNRVTFSYTLDNGQTQETYMDVMDGKDGKDGSDAVTPEAIQEAVDNYLDENPVQPGATEEQAQQIEENKEAIEQLKKDSENYLMEIPIATAETIGGVISDGETINIDENGVISAKTGATKEQVEQIEQNTADIEQIQEDLQNYVSKDDFPSYSDVYGLLESEV